MFVKIDKILDKYKCKNILGLLLHPHFGKKSGDSKGETCPRSTSNGRLCYPDVIIDEDILQRLCGVISQVTQTVVICPRYLL